MSKFGRPDAKVHFGTTGKPNVSTKPVIRDEIGDIQLSVSLDTVSGRTRVDFGKPVTYIALPADKAYDFAHLILEHVKDKLGGEPVNVTEEKILAAIEHALDKSTFIADGAGGARVFAADMLPHFMQAMAGETDTPEKPGVPGLDTRLRP